MFSFLEQGSLYFEAILSRQNEDGPGVWAAPLYLTAMSTAFGLLKNTPSNVYLSDGFWEWVLREWSLAQFILP